MPRRAAIKFTQRYIDAQPAPNPGGNQRLIFDAHSVGLGHTSAKGQAMYPYIDGGWQGRRWGNGDQTGLSSVGSRRGCYPFDRAGSATSGGGTLVPVFADERHG